MTEETAQAVQVDEVRIICRDGFPLAATHFIPTKVIAAVMIAPATGIKRQFYAAFAKSLAVQGYAVTTFDNRGIGDSIQGELNDHEPSLLNWGRRDMTAVLEWLKQSFPQVDYHLIGHSAGGQLVGLMNNALDLTSMLSFASSSGSMRYMKLPFRWKSLFWFDIYVPLSNLLFGHAKSQWVGMGEPLPKRVAEDWGRWCHGTGYVAVDLNSRIKEHLYDELQIPSCWLYASDDDIANEDTVRDMVRVYSRSNAEVSGLIPEEHGFEEIGHMKFFSKKKRKLWNIAYDWLSCFHPSLPDQDS